MRKRTQIRQASKATGLLRLRLDGRGREKPGDARCSRLAVCCLVGFLILSSSGIAVADQTILPASLQVPLILKVLTYDQYLLAHTGDTIRLGYLEREEAPSASEYDAFAREIERFRGQTIRGRSLELVSVRVADPDSLPDRYLEYDFHVLYVGQGCEDWTGSIARFTRANKILSITGIEEYVEGVEGLSVALVLRGGKMGLTINLPASRLEDREWDASLLRLSRVIR